MHLKKIISVNFDKMMSRKDNDLLNYQSLDIPSFNKYLQGILFELSCLGDLGSRFGLTVGKQITLAFD